MRRPDRALVRALTLGALAIAVASTGLARPPDARAVGTASGTYFGAYGGSEEITRTRLLENLGVQSARVYIEWALLEADAAANQQVGLVDSARLRDYDQRLINLKSAGITPILMIGAAPLWAASRERGPLYADGYDAYTRFMGKIVTRWSSSTYGVHHWELWAEPDFGDEVPGNIQEPARTALQARRAWGDNPTEYANMLKAAYPAIKSIDPSATVILGALAYDWFRLNGQKAGDNASSPGFNEGGPMVYHFLDDVLDAGGACCFDWLGFNSYMSFATEWERNQSYAAWDVAAKARHIQGRLAAHGVSKPLIAMESGIWSCCTNGTGFVYYVKPDKSLGDFTPDEATQADYLARLYLRGLSVDLKGIFWWLIEDFETPQQQVAPDNHRGWFHKDLTPKAAARTMRLLTARLAGASYGGTYTPARLVSGQPVEGHSFTRANGSTVRVLFNPYGPGDTSVVEVEAGAVIYDADGQVVPAEAVSPTRVRLTVGFRPVFLDTFGALGNRGIVPVLARNASAS